MTAQIKLLEQGNRLCTNSIIYVQSQVNANELCYHWERSAPNPYHPLHNIESCNSASHQYICTPLDYNCMILLTVSYGNQYQNFKYGPIQIQKQLISRVKNQRLKHTQNQYHGSFVQSGHKQPVLIKIQGNSIHISSEKLKIVANGKTIQKKQQPNIIKVEARNNFYQLLYYVGKNYTKTGYIQLQFKNRLQRDQLVFQFMEINGIYVKQLAKRNQRLLSSTNSIQTPTLLPNNSPAFKNMMKNVSFDQEKMKKKKIMTDIQKDVDKLIASEDDQTPPEQLIQDIYDILYSPTASYSQKKQQKNKPIQHGDLLASCHSLIDHLQDNEKPSKVKDKTPVKKIKSQTDIETFSPQPSQIFEFAHDNLSMGQKIAHLVKINNQLMQENQKLRQTNRKLRSNKNNQTDYEKVKDIKNMIADMAKRIAYLQGFNHANEKFSNLPQSNRIQERKSPERQKKQSQEKKQGKFVPKKSMENKNLVRKNHLVQHKPKILKKPLQIMSKIHPGKVDPHFSPKTSKNQSLKEIHPQAHRKTFIMPNQPPNFRATNYTINQGSPKYIQGQRIYSPKFHPK